MARDPFEQLPGVDPARPGRNVLVRADGAGGTHDFTRWLTGRRVQYRVGYTLPFNTPDLLQRIPAEVWQPAYDAGGGIRDGAYVAELTNLLDLSDWPKGLRVITRRERPHLGAQLRFTDTDTDTDGKRVTAFATYTLRDQLADLELRHRHRARCEDRIRIAKDTGRTNLPLQSFDADHIWCAIVMLAVNLLAWTQTLARTGRRIKLHLNDTAPFADLAATGWTRLDAFAPP